MRLIQLSDCHVMSDPKGRAYDVSTLGSLRAMIERCKNTEKKADGYIFTGDISADGSRESYQNIKPVLSLINKPMYALPGNHDDLLEMREQLRKQWQCVHSVDLHHWQILLLNSQVIGETFGQVSEADLNWLRLWLSASTQKHTLIAIHHPPVAVGSAWIDAKGLNNGGALLNTLKEFDHVKGIIFGHAHQAFDSQFEHIRILGCPSSAYQFAANQDEFSIDSTLRPGYRWLELGDSGDIDTGIIRLKA